MSTDTMKALRIVAELAPETDAVSALASAEARAYSRTPHSTEERAAFRAMARAQQRVMNDLALTDGW